MEYLVIIGLIVWFISTIPETTRRYQSAVRAEAMERKQHEREDAYFDKLKALADAGDKQAIGTLSWFGFNTVAHGWETRDERNRRLSAVTSKKVRKQSKAKEKAPAISD